MFQKLKTTEYIKLALLKKHKGRANMVCNCKLRFYAFEPSQAARQTNACRCRVDILIIYYNVYIVTKTNV